MATSIAFDIYARDRGASGTFNKVGSSATGAGGKLGKLGGVGKAAGLALASGAAIAGLAAIKLGGDSVRAASDLNETLSKSRVIFGQNSVAMEKWATGAYKSAGLSKQAALESAASFGDMFSQLGFAGGEAARMSKSVVRLAADLGSFNNLPTSEVTDMMSAAFRGEYDSLQRVIPNINAARVETEALARTGKKSAKELTAQEKAAATLAIVQRDGARAAGDFKRTSGGLANQQKILGAQFENLKASIGTKLLPVAVKLTNWMTSTGMPALSRMGMFLSANLGPAFRRVGDFIQTKVIPAFRGISQGTGRTSTALSQFKANFSSVFASVVSITQSVAGFAQKFWARYGDLIQRFGISSLRNFLTSLRGFANVVTGVFKVISSVLKGDWRGAWNGVKQIARGAMQLISGAVGQFWNALRTLFAAGGRALGDSMRAAWDKAKDAARAGVKRVVQFVSNLPGRVVAALGDLSMVLYNAGKALIGGLAKGIKDKMGDVVGSVKDGLGKVKGLLPGSPIKWGPLTSWNNGGAGKRLMETLASGIRKGSNSPVMSVERMLDRMNAALGRARDKLSGLRELRAAFTSTFTSDSIFGADLDTTGKSISGLLAFSQSQASKAAQLAADIQRVTGMGLSKALIEELRQQGSSGAEQLHLLAGGTAEQIRMFNALNAQTQASLASAGLLAGNAGRGGSIDADIAKAKREEAMVERIIKRLHQLPVEVHVHLEGETIVTSVKKRNKRKGVATAGI